MASLPRDLDDQIRRRMQAGFDMLTCAAIETMWKIDELNVQLAVLKDMRAEELDQLEDEE